MPQISWNVSHGTLPQHRLDFYLSKNYYMGGQMKDDEIRGSEARMHPGDAEKQLIFFIKKKNRPMGVVV